MDLGVKKGVTARCFEKWSPLVEREELNPSPSAMMFQN